MIAYSGPVPGFLTGEKEPHPDNDGSFGIRKPNGKVVCVTPEGAIEERDSMGAWEKFWPAKGGAALAERERGAYVFSIVERA